MRPSGRLQPAGKRGSTSAGLVGTKLEPEAQLPGLNPPLQILVPRWDLQRLSPSAWLTGAKEKLPALPPLFR